MALVSNELGLSIARGRIIDHSSFHGYGSNPSIGTTLVTVWSQNTLYTYPATGLQMSVVSTSANDTTAGTGARLLFIAGLDVNRLPISEVVILNGLTPVLTVGLYYRINTVTVLTAGSLTSNDGTINITNTAVLYAVVLPTEGQSQAATYSLSANQAAYVTALNFSTGTGKAVEYQSWIRPLNGAFLKRGATQVVQSATQVILHPPVKVPRGADLELRAIADAAATKGSAGFDIILVTE